MKKAILLQGITYDSFRQDICQDILKQFLAAQSSNKSIPNEGEKLLTPDEASKFLKVDRSTLWRWTKSNKVKNYGIAGRRYYKKSELLNLLKEF